MSHLRPDLKDAASDIELLLTDVDGVLTDTGVYYSPEGELLKRFSIRDGMGAERLRKHAGIDVGIVTGENSPIVARRAEKLHIEELHLGIKDKLGRLEQILERRGLNWSQIAYIGDDMNDMEVLDRVGLSAAPSDAMPEIRAAVDYVCTQPGGHGAFRDFAELILALRFI